MDKYGLIDKIKHLDGLTVDEKSALLGLLRSHKKYGLVWEDKPEAVEDELKEKLPVLTEVKDKAIVNDTDTDHYPNHILIEGDNLHALTVLSYTHSNSIDVIYIDPPYNTGNKDFIYNDKFVDNEDSYRHSKWLSFMSKRLKVAKNLLSDRGVIFISIDDNEQADLKLLCDEIFNEKNFIADLIWQKKFSRANDALYFSTMHDHILCYCKKNIAEFPKEGWHIGLLERQGEIPKGYSNPDNDPRGVWTSTIMSAKSGSDSLLYEIKTPGGRIVTPPSGRYWSCSKDTFEKWKSENRIWFGKDGNGTPRKKTFLSEVQSGLRPNSLIFQEIGGNNQEGKQELKAIFGGSGVFDGPKPTKLIKLLLTIANCKNANVLDFFAGSGTTLDATMKLNAEDGGHRQCILVTNNENGICENVTYVRNKKVIEGYTTPKGEQVAGLTHNNLRYYKTDFVPRDRTVKNMRDLVNAATDMLCIKENMYKEQTLFGPWDELPSFIARHFVDGEGGEMIIIYDETQIREIAKAIKGMKFEKPLKVYVFSTDRDPYEDEFNDVLDKVELCALPAAIYDAYVQVIPRPQDKNVEIAVNSNEEYLDSWDDGVQMEMDLAAEEDHR